MFVGARPMTDYDIYQQQRGDAIFRDSLAQNAYLADRRAAMRSDREAGMAAAANAEAERQQQRWMLEKQQAEAAQQAQIGRDYEYQVATDPALRRLNANEKSMFANDEANRQANLMMTQGRANAFVNTERMQDQRALAVTQAQLDAIGTMQKGNIDARLLSLQGQNAQSLAGVNNQFAMNRDAAQSGNAMNEDAWSRMQNRKAALMEMESFEQQNGVQLPQPDQEKRDSLWEEYRRIEDLVDKKEINPRQGLTRMDEITRKLGQIRATIKQVPLAQRFQNESIREPDGRIVTQNPKGGWDVHMPPPGVKQDQIDPDAKALKQKEYDLKVSQSIAKEVTARKDAYLRMPPGSKVPSDEEIENSVRKSYGLPPMQQDAPASPDGSDPQELFRHVASVNAFVQRQAQASGVSPMEVFQSLPDAAKEQYRQGMALVQQQQQGPAADPRSGAMSGPAVPRSQGQPPQQMRPGLPGPVDPRMLQGQPAQAPSAPARQPFVGQNMRTGEAPPQQVAPPQQQAAAALQIFKQLTANGFPKPGTEEERLVMEAAAFLKKNGIDPTGGVRRSPKTGGPLSQGYLK